MNAVDDLDLSDTSPEQVRAVFRDAMEKIIILISPFAPHIAAELWVELGRSVHIAVS